MRPGLFYLRLVAFCLVTAALSAEGTELITNGGFESGSTGWTITSGIVGPGSASHPVYAGAQCAWLNGRGRNRVDSLSQSLTIPAAALEAKLSFYLHIDTDEKGAKAADTLVVQIRDGATVLATLATYSNLDKAPGYVLRTMDVSAYKGKAVQVVFLATEDSVYQTSFMVDNVSLIVLP